MTAPRTLAKICGLSTAEGLDAALAHGADFVGAVVFAASPRHVAPIEGRTLFERARGRAKVVAVLVDPDDALLTEVGLILRPDLIQLHGSESPARCVEAGRLAGAAVIKAVSVSGPANVDAAGAYEDAVAHLMFDARPPQGAALPGGVGARFDWSILAGRRFARPWFLAGGLDPSNVAEAVAVTGAPMVDVSSGVERAPGVKDAARIAAFLGAVGRPVSAASPGQ